MTDQSEKTATPVRPRVRSEGFFPRSPVGMVVLGGEFDAIMSDDAARRLLLPEPVGASRLIDPSTVRPLTLEELRGIAREVAHEAGYGSDAPEEVLMYDYSHCLSTLTSRGLHATDVEELYLRSIAGQITILDDTSVLTPEEILKGLGTLGEQAYVVATIVTVLLQEREIAVDPAATSQEKEEARFWRWEGFNVLNSDIARAVEASRVVASVYYDIEQRKLTAGSHSTRYGEVGKRDDT